MLMQGGVWTGAGALRRGARVRGYEARGCHGALPPPPPPRSRLSLAMPDPRARAHPAVQRRGCDGRPGAAGGGDHAAGRRGRREEG
eukprot:3830269-Rhodomonas_salina.3